MMGVSDVMSGINSEVVRRKRIALNYTQEKLAEEARLSRSHIQRIEKENINCSIETVKKIARVLDCEYSELTDTDKEE